ncbi:MAG: hypothetical protein ACK56F_24160, partial [bacterium]
MKAREHLPPEPSVDHVGAVRRRASPRTGRSGRPLFDGRRRVTGAAPPRPQRLLPMVHLRASHLPPAGQALLPLRLRPAILLPTLRRRGARTPEARRRTRLRQDLRRAPRGSRPTGTAPPQDPTTTISHGSPSTRRALIRD